jgi:hypothetical protein
MVKREGNKKVGLLEMKQKKEMQKNTNERKHKG